MEMKLGRRVVLMIVGAAAIPVAGVACAPPGPSCWDTYPETVCVYSDDNFRGSLEVFEGDDYDYSNNYFDNGDGVNDEASSIVNLTGKWLVTYSNKGYDVIRICIAPGRSEENLARQRHGFLSHPVNDQISSHRLFTDSEFVWVRRQCLWIVEKDGQITIPV